MPAKWCSVVLIVELCMCGMCVMFYPSGLLTLIHWPQSNKHYNTLTCYYLAWLAQYLMPTYFKAHLLTLFLADSNWFHIISFYHTKTTPTATTIIVDCVIKCLNVSNMKKKKRSSMPYITYICSPLPVVYLSGCTNFTSYSKTPCSKMLYMYILVQS